LNSHRSGIVPERLFFSNDPFTMRMDQIVGFACSRVCLSHAVGRSTMTLFDPKTGQFVTIDPRPRR
jgi:hypothetical protein